MKLKKQSDLFKTLDEIEVEDQLGVVESLLFAVGDDGVSLEQLEYVLECSEDEVLFLLKLLKQRYRKGGSGFDLIEVGSVYKLTTKKDHAVYLRRLVQNPNQRGLTSAALEVLAIIAYKQPITRQEVEHIRGSNSENVLRRLLTFALIEEAGRLEAPGRPMLYQTAEGFLDHFGIKTLEELPDLPDLDEEYVNKEDETELFTSNQTETQKQTENLKMKM